MPDMRTLAAISLLCLTLAACASYEQQHVEYGASQYYVNSVTANDITLAADPYDTEAEVVEAFDENLLEKGYYPIKILIENYSADRVMVYRDSIALQASSGHNYRPVTAATMAEDFEDNKMAYALLGFGIFSYMSAEEANSERIADYQSKDFAETQVIPASGSRGAFVYFQLPQGTNVNASRLSLDVESLESREITRLELHLGQRDIGAAPTPSTVAAQTSSTVANLPETPPFDGVWNLEISDTSAPDDKDRIQTVISNGLFSASFSTNGWRGELSGEINEFGTLLGTGTASKMAWGSNNAPLDFTTQYRSGGFKVDAITKGRVKTTFRISLIRDEAGG